MHLDGLFHGAEIGSDLLVELSGDNVLQDFSLAWGEARSNANGYFSVPTKEQSDKPNNAISIS